MPLPVAPPPVVVKRREYDRFRRRADRVESAFNADTAQLVPQRSVATLKHRPGSDRQRLAGRNRQRFVDEVAPRASQAAGSAGNVELVPIVPASSTTCEPAARRTVPTKQIEHSATASAQQTPVLLARAVTEESLSSVGDGAPALSFWTKTAPPCCEGKRIVLDHRRAFAPSSHTRPRIAHLRMHQIDRTDRAL